MIDDFAARCVHALLGPVADVHCGPGRVTAHLAERGADVVGIDLSRGMIDVARRAHPALDAYLPVAFQAGDGRRVDRARAYGHPVPLTSYRHDPEHLGTVLEQGGFEVRTSLLRSPEGRETSPQAVLPARRGR